MKDYSRFFERKEARDLTLESCSADDPKLPQPRGKAARLLQPSKQELAHLEATRQLGGLVPEIHGQGQAWQCPDCESIYPLKASALACHNQTPNQVQTCARCGRRIARCKCPNRFERKPQD
jgi:hypothetical protein